MRSSVIDFIRLVAATSIRSQSVYASAIGAQIRQSFTLVYIYTEIKQFTSQIVHTINLQVPDPKCNINSVSCERSKQSFLF